MSTLKKFLMALPVVGAIATLNIGCPVLAANQIIVKVGSLERTISISALEDFVKTGDTSDLPIEFSSPFFKTDVEKLRKQLKRPVSIDPNSSLDPLEEDLLNSLMPNSTEEERKAALTLMAEKGNGLILMNFLQVLPGETLTSENFMDSLNAYQAIPIKTPDPEPTPIDLSTGETAKSSLAANLVINGSFEEVALPNKTWTTFPYGYEVPAFHNLASIPGWKVDPGSRFELQHYAAGTPAQGFQLVELDASLKQKGSIYQEILTEPGQMYNLKFAFSPRQNTPISDNILQVNWGDDIVDTLSEDGIGLADTAWKYYTYTLRATSNTTRLAFFDLGTINNRGTYIDDVSVERVEPIVRKSVPEPSSMLGLLAFGTFGAASRLKRKQQQKVLND